MNYYLWLNESQAGPYTITQVRGMWAVGDITAHTLFWNVGMEEWLPLEKIKHEIEPPRAKAPPSIPVSNPDRFSELPQISTSGETPILKKVLIVVGVLMALMLFGALHKKGGNGEDEKFDAYYTATSNFVPAHLKAPSTAQFADFKNSTVTVEGNIYTVSGYVDSQNSFGAMLHSRFTCTMRFNKDRGTWEHISTTIP